MLLAQQLESLKGYPVTTTVSASGRSNRNERQKPVQLMNHIATGKLHLLPLTQKRIKAKWEDHWKMGNPESL